MWIVRFAAMMPSMHRDRIGIAEGSNRPRHWRRARGAHVVLGILFASTVGARAQDAPSRPPTPAATPTVTGPDAPETPPPAEPGTTELAVPALEERIKQLEAAAQPEDGVKTQIIKALKDALDRVRLADDWAAKAADYEKKRIEAPDRLKAIAEELAKPPTEPKADVPEGASLQQLEQLLAQEELALKAIQTELAALEDQRKTRNERKLKIPEEIAAAKLKFEEVGRDLGVAAPSEEPPELVAAKRATMLARKRALEQELACYDKEVLSYDARGELINARRDLKARQAAEKEKLVAAWRELVNARRRDEARLAAEEAERKQRDAARQHPVVQRLAKENVELAERRKAQAFARNIESVTEELDQVLSADKEQSTAFEDLRNKVQVGGLSSGMALLLRNKLDRLPDIRRYQRRINSRQQALATLRVELFDAEASRADLADLEPNVRAALAEVEPSITGERLARIETALRELLAARRGLLDSIINDYGAYLEKLAALESAEKLLISRVNGYAEYLREHILWVPSASPLHPSDGSRLVQAVAWLLSPKHWLAALDAIRTAIGDEPVTFGGFSLLVLALFAAQPTVRRRLRDRSEEAARRQAARLAPTLAALLLTALIAAPWPALLLVAAWLTGVPIDTPDFVKAVAAGARTTGFMFFVAEFVRQTCRPGGLGEDHFGWSVRNLRLFRRNLLWLMALLLPLVFVAATIESDGDEERRSTLGRLAFVLGHCARAVFLMRVFRPTGGFFHETIRRSPGGWVDRLRYVWYPTLIGVPIVLAALGLAGYYYTAFQLTLRLQATLWTVLLLVVANAVLLRWTLITRRKLALEQYRKKRIAAQADAAAAATEGAAPAPVAEAVEPEIDLSAISQQTKNLIHSAIFMTLIVSQWLVWVDVLPALRVLDRVPLWDTTVTVSRAADGGAGEAVTSSTIHTITLADLALCLLIVLMTFMATKNIPGLLEIVILQKLPLEPSSRYAITTVSRYVLTIVGAVLAFGAVGITWSTVQWLAAAITVGLGFGLQEIFANFVSGLILLFERPIRTGDTVTVGGISGTVSRIRIRATTITDWDRKELIIPNKEFVTGQVVNWTLSDRVLRVVIPVGIAYGSDTQLARDLLLDAAAKNKRILDDPPPQAFFLSFGGSALNFELRGFLRDVEDYLSATHELHVAIDYAFRKAGIEIAFPQRDIHVRSVAGAAELLAHLGTQRTAPPPDGSPTA